MFGPAANPTRCPVRPRSTTRPHRRRPPSLTTTSPQWNPKPTRALAKPRPNYAETTYKPPPDRILSIAETAVTNAKAMIAAGEVVSQVIDIVPRLMTEAQRFRPRLVHQLSQPAGPA